MVALIYTRIVAPVEEFRARALSLLPRRTQQLRETEETGEN